MKLDFDSVYVICKYKDLKKRIKKDNNKENAEFRFATLDSLMKIRKDTVLIGRQLILDYVREADDLVKANKVSFFDQRNNKKVLHVQKTKDGNKKLILYYIYTDADTKNELYHILIRTSHPF